MRFPVWIVPLASALAALVVVSVGYRDAAGADPSLPIVAAPVQVESAQPSPPLEAALPAAEPTEARWVPASGSQTVIGYSQAGRPLTVYHLGESPWSVLILGGQHGGPEINTVRLVWQLLDYFERNPQEIPAGLRLDIMPEANPDGIALGSRQFLSGVDPNRNWGGGNWGGGNWSPDAQDSNGVFRIGLGGREPFSEPETQALRDYVLFTRPVFTINYHSRGGFFFGGGGPLGNRIAEAYAAHSGYWRPGATGGAGTPGGTAGSVLGYRATGSMNPWLSSQGFAAMLVELATSSDSEYSRNLPALKAALAILAE